MDEEDDEDDDEEEKFDIDDLSPETSSSTVASSPGNGSPTDEPTIDAEAAAASLINKHGHKHGIVHPHAYSRSGVTSPERFGGPHPHIPLSPHRAVDHHHHARRGETLKTPRAGEGGDHPHHHGRRHTVTVPTNSHHRAFAVYGQDESDTSGSEL